MQFPVKAYLYLYGACFDKPVLSEVEGLSTNGFLVSHR